MGGGTAFFLTVFAVAGINAKLSEQRAGRRVRRAARGLLEAAKLRLSLQTWGCRSGDSLKLLLGVALAGSQLLAEGSLEWRELMGSSLKT